MASALPSSSAEPKTPTLTFMMRAFGYRNYRLFFSGQIISLVGTWMTTTATSWLVYRLTGSALLLGVVGFAGQFPAFLLSPIAGIFVDRWNRHHLLIVTQFFSMVGSFVLAGLALTHRMTIPALIVLSVVQGLVNAFDLPCRQSFIVDVIEKKEDLGNAIALNSSMFNAARLLGPSIAGMIIAASSEGWCFFADGISYLAVITALFFMQMKTRPPRPAREAHILRQLQEGWVYVASFRPIRSIILLLALVSLVVISSSVLMPIFAGHILHGGPSTLGLLMTCSGAGALLGALGLAARRSVVGLGRMIPIATTIVGVGLIGFSFSRVIWLSLPLMTMMGFGFMVQMASSNTILQTIVEDDKRGRVMSFFMMAFLGTAPFGSLLAGVLSNHIGAPHTLLACGIFCLIGAAWFARELPELRESIRPIYIRLGILREVTSAVETTSELLGTPEG